MEEETTADTSIAAGEVAILQQHFEGQDVQQLKKGTSDAEKVTVSFYVKGNATATYTCGLFDNDNSRQNNQTFDVTTSWNRVSLTFNADTTGALDDDNANSLGFYIYLHAGTTYTSGTFASNTWAAYDNAKTVLTGKTSFFDSTDRELFITGLQMETGSQATPFEHRSFGEELALCERYFKSVTYENGGIISVGLAYSDGTSAIAPMDYKGAKMRAVPTITMPSAGQSGGNVSFLATSTSYPSTIGSHTASNIGVSHYSLRGASYSGLGSNGDTSWLYTVGTVVFKYDSEL